MLILGNVEFEVGRGEDSSVVTKDSKTQLEVAAQLLGLEGSSEKLADALVVQVITYTIPLLLNFMCVE